MNKLTFAFVFAALVFIAPAHAETVNCNPITTLPYTINTQGIYCLTGELSTIMTSGNAITINTNNVVLDLNGFKLGGLGAGPGTQATGIYANQLQNITIKNGTVRGFLYGIFLDDVSPYTTSQGHLIEDIRADQNTLVALLVSGNGNIIRNNQVVTTRDTTVLGANVSAYGILVNGPAAQLLNNMVTEVAAQGTGVAFGINLNQASNSVVAGNRVSNVTSPNAIAYGIYLIQASNSVVAGNHISIVTSSPINTYGIYLSGASGTDLIVSDNRLSGVFHGIVFFGASTGKYMNNMTQGVTVPYVGGTAAGTTNY